MNTQLSLGPNYVTCVELVPTGAAAPPADGSQVIDRLLDEGVVHGDAEEWLPLLPRGAVDLFFTSPPLR